jgi:plasmid stabilization system protein ParE
MDFKVIFKDTFLADLARIVGLISAHNPVAALRLGRIIVQTSESLSFFPERYPTVRQRPGIRRFIVKKHYKVFYRVLHAPRTVEVLRCWDGHREVDPVL